MERSGKVLDMTRGKPVRMILAFAIPLLIGNVFQQVYSMADTMVAGYCLGDRAIAAIGAMSALYSLIISMSVGLNSGFAVVVTQSFGAHDEGKLRKAIGGMMVLDAAITVLLTGLSLVFLPALMRLMNTPESIFDQAYSYMAIICAGMTATISYNMFAGILRSFGNSRTPLYFLIFTSLLNIALDYTTPTYRDASVGRYLLDHLPGEKISVLRYEHAEPNHLGFLKKMGYREQNGAHERPCRRTRIRRSGRKMAFGEGRLPFFLRPLFMLCGLCRNNS